MLLRFRPELVFGWFRLEPVSWPGRSRYGVMLMPDELYLVLSVLCWGSVPGTLEDLLPRFGDILGSTFLKAGPFEAEPIVLGSFTPFYFSSSLSKSSISSGKNRSFFWLPLLIYL